MQIQWPGTAGDLGFTSKTQLLAPCANIRAGGRYLRMLLDRYQGDIHLALAAYNYGMGRIKQGMRKLPDGAAWYSGYIYDHLQYVLSRVATAIPQEYTESRKKRIIVFNDPDRAGNFAKLLRMKIPELRFDWFRMGLGRFQVVLRYTKEEELKKGQQLLGMRFGFFL